MGFRKRSSPHLPSLQNHSCLCSGQYAYYCWEPMMPDAPGGRNLESTAGSFHATMKRSRSVFCGLRSSQTRQMSEGRRFCRWSVICFLLPKDSPSNSARSVISKRARQFPLRIINVFKKPLQLLSMRNQKNRHHTLKREKGQISLENKRLVA